MVSRAEPVRITLTGGSRECRHLAKDTTQIFCYQYHGCVVFIVCIVKMLDLSQNCKFSIICRCILAYNDDDDDDELLSVHCSMCPCVFVLIICGCIRCRMKSLTLLLSTVLICVMVSGNRSMSSAVLLKVWRMSRLTDSNAVRDSTANPAGTAANVANA